MSSLKKIIAILIMLAIGSLAVLLFLSQYYYEKALKNEDQGKRIEVLKKSIRYFPFNGLALYELGKANYDLSLEKMSQVGTATGNGRNLLEAVENFRRALRFNPALPLAHLRLARALIYLSTVSEAPEVNPYDEFRKSAELAGNNSEILFEIGKVFLARWADLAPEYRDFAAGVLRRIVENPEKLQALLPIWEMNARDYDLMREVLPNNPGIQKIYARFLGEKSLSLQERQKALALADSLDFKQVKAMQESAERELFNNRTRDAFEHFQLCLIKLESIPFYQSLTREGHIDQSEYKTLRKSAYLNMAKSRLREGATFRDVEENLLKFLSLEDKAAAADELESYLREWKIIPAKPEDKLDDLDLLSFQLWLYFRQNRYREIIRIGRLFMQSFNAVPKDKIDRYIMVLQLTGDSCQKVDFLYDAWGFFKRAEEIGPENLNTLLKIRQNHNRLNDEKKAAEVTKKIVKVLSPRETALEDNLIEKGHDRAYPLVLEGKKITLNLTFKNATSAPAPLITVLFNGQVFWEDYLKSGRLAVPVETVVGKNTMEIRAVNKNIILVKVAYE